MTTSTAVKRHGNAVPSPDERARAESALTLRISGLPYADIAEQLGWADESGARHAVTRLLDRRESESVHTYRQIETARLEQVMSQYLPAALTGDVDAARVVLATHDRIAKLHGLDRPTQVELSAPMSPTEVIAQARERLTALCEARALNAGTPA